MQNIFEILLKNPLSNELKNKLKGAECKTKDDEEFLLVQPTNLPSVTKFLHENKQTFRIIGSPNALVVLFEFFKGTMGWPEKTSKGLARLIPVDDQTLFVDSSVSGIDNGEWNLNIHEYGDLSSGVESTGSVFLKLGMMDIKDGKGTWSGNVKAKTWELVGKAMCLTRGKDSVCGILARSAGAFENKKRVCACSGKTIWEEDK
ncbi:copper chaperone [Terramyces sp. JEL0728]|nr:copper chaperone [Terramyces sp. JEL0728]